MPKITVVGAGNVGAECAYRCAQKKLGDIVLLDIVEGLAQGKALDMMQAGSFEGFDVNINGTNDYSDTKDSQVAVITAGLTRKPGMSRDELIEKNAQIVGQITKQIAISSPGAILIIVSNPLDAMTCLALRTSNFKHQKVMGMAPLLDESRMQHFLAEAAGVKRHEVKAALLGSHGDLMVPLPEHSTIKGKPLTDFLSKKEISAIMERTKQGGAEIVNLLKTGSAFYAPGSAAAEMAEAVIKDSKKIIGTCAYLTGQYGLKDVYVGVPARLGKGGIEEIIELKLSSEEKAALEASVQAVKKLCARFQ